MFFGGPGDQAFLPKRPQSLAYMLARVPKVFGEITLAGEQGLSRYSIRPDDGKKDEFTPLQAKVLVEHPRPYSKICVNTFRHTIRC